jgi:undecaprenyl-diphosphatase
VQQREGETPPGEHRVADAAARLGKDQVAALLVEASKEIATSSGEMRAAREQAVQEVTAPEQHEERDPSLLQPLSLLRGAVLEQMGPLQALDTRAFLAINHLPHPRWANTAMQRLTQVMNGGWGWVLILLGVAIFDRPRGQQALRGIVPALWFATMAIEYPIKTFFRRRRPFIDVVQVVSVGRKPGTYSFPSGHAASAFAGAWLLSRYYPQQAPVWYTIATLVAFSRIYLGVHYPGDVLSGATSGVVLAEAVRWMVDQPEPTNA